MKNLVKNLDNFSKRKIAVIGDLMLDKYIFGKVERISPEAPVQIVTVERENYVPGGAANAASNVSSLTGEVYLIGVVGNDIAKDILVDQTKERMINTSGIVIDPTKPTIQKIRVLGQNQQLLRIDYEDKEYINGDLNEKLFASIMKIDGVDAVIVSDYAKGTITRGVMEGLKKYCKERNVLLIVDPKPEHKLMYKGVSLITPNKKEAEEISGVSIESENDLERVGKKIMEDLQCNVIITTGERGMSIFESGSAPIHIPTVAKEVYDVSGAGDTVIATLSLALSSGANLRDAAIISNHAAGIKVGKLGTATVSKQELVKSLNRDE